MSTLQNKIIKSIKTHILQLSYKAKSSHIGGCLSIVEIVGFSIKDFLLLFPFICKQYFLKLNQTLSTLNIEAIQKSI